MYIYILFIKPVCLFNYQVFIYRLITSMPRFIYLFPGMPILMISPYNIQLNIEQVMIYSL